MSAENFAKMSRTTYDEFERVQLADDYPPPQELLSALKKIITSSSTSVEAVAQEIAVLFLNNIPASGIGLPDCSLLWRTLLEAINAFTDKTDKFVDLVLALFQFNNGKNLFKKSPEFDQHMTEFALGMQDYRNDETNRKARRQGQINEHAFMSLLSARAHGRNILPNEEIVRAGFVLRSTCEFAPWEKTSFPDIDDYFDEGDDEDEWRAYRDKELEMFSIRILNVKVPAAYHWLKNEGQRIYKLEGEMQGEHEWQDEDLVGKWKGGKGYSKERFAFWRERFEWMTKVTALEHETQRLAGECAKIMKGIEEGK